jgi:hypothetical protein
MRVDVFGRYSLDVERTSEVWAVYRVGEGKRASVPEIAIPSHLDEDQVIRYLGDLLHECATPGRSIRRLDRP